MKKLNICYFDNDMGEFNEFNPRYVLNQKYTIDILSYLSNKSPYYYSCEDIMNKFKINHNELDNILKLLNNIDSINIKNGKLRLNFTFFPAKDIKKIKKITNKVLNQYKRELVNGVIKIKDCVTDLYPDIDYKLSLYHLLCGKIFDGEFFDYLGYDGFLKMSYPRKDNRDYMLIGYHDDVYSNNFNNGLFCSFNNARYNQNSLTSFGTPNERYDYFRFFKLRAINNIHGKFVRLNKLLESENDSTIMEKSFEIINDIINNKTVENNKYLQALKDTDYISKENRINVPVFVDYKENIKIINNCVINELGEKIKECLNVIKNKVINANLLCLEHSAPIDEVCNELWHIFFGLLNNYLINKKIVARPKRYLRQGQYLKCVYINKEY